MSVTCTCPGWGRALNCPFHGDAAQIFNRPDKTQLDRIEDKLDWLHAKEHGYNGTVYVSPYPWPGDRLPVPEGWNPETGKKREEVKP